MHSLWERVWPSFRTGVLLQYISEKELKKTYKVAVETGTFVGASSLELTKLFEKVYTIEVDPNLYRLVSERFKDRKDITCILGDSASILPRLQLDDPALFYLDSHWSGNRHTDWQNSEWKGYHLDTGFRKLQEGSSRNPSSEEQLPLKDELTYIFDTFPYQAIVYIDDMDKFDEKGQGYKNRKFVGEDWSHFNIQKFLTDETRKKRITKEIQRDNQLFLFLAPLKN